MADQKHPITPPPELVKQWWKEAQKSNDPDIVCWLNYVATQAARWGADQELEACCKIALTDPCCGTKLQRENLVRHIKKQRRPEPQSLKKQALAWCNDYIDPDGVIRRALEQLDD